MTPAWLHAARTARPYPFVRLLDAIEARREAGLPVYDFGTGDPKEPTPEAIRRALIASLGPVCRYPSVKGQEVTRTAIAAWLHRRFGVSVDPGREIIPSSGSKEAVFHSALAFVPREGSRRRVLYPTPGYPVYEAGARLAGGIPEPYRLDAKARFLPDPGRIPAAVLDETAMFWICSPHNPTGAVIPSSQLAELVAAAREHGFLLASDECYADVYFTDPPASALEHGTEAVLAFHSLSKRSGMTGYRSGFVAGDRRAIAAYLALRPNFGVASSDFVQAAAVAAWGDDAHAAERRALFATKRALFEAFFAELGLELCASDATFYLWVRVPEGYDEESYAARLLGAGIVVSPGSVFGAGGEGFFRLALVPELDECRAAIEAWRGLFPPTQQRSEP